MGGGEHRDSDREVKIGKRRDGKGPHRLSKRLGRGPDKINNSTDLREEQEEDQNKHTKINHS